MRHIVYGDPKRLFSFRLEGRACLPAQCRSDLPAISDHAADRGFRTLDFINNGELNMELFVADAPLGASRQSGRCGPAGEGGFPEEGSCGP